MTDQTGPGSTYVATDCARLNSGDNCGHDFGTALSAIEKEQLLVYLKTP
jgi:hypothetical protein